MSFHLPLEIGKQIRIRRLLDSSGLMLAVPMDHGYTLGPIKGLININQTVVDVYKGGASCVILNRGMLRSVYQSIPKNRGFMLHISGSSSISAFPNHKIPTADVNTAIKLGADGVSCHVNIGSDGDMMMLSTMSEMVETADLYDLPTLAMMYVRGDDGVTNIDATNLAHAGRIAEESGINIVKLNATADGKDFDEVTQGIRIPIIVAGGDVRNDFIHFLDIISNCIINGAAGVSIGRNIFQASDPQLAMKKLTERMRKLSKEVDHIGSIH